MAALLPGTRAVVIETDQQLAQVLDTVNRSQIVALDFETWVCEEPGTNVRKEWDAAQAELVLLQLKAKAAPYSVGGRRFPQRKTPISWNRPLGLSVCGDGAPDIGYYVNIGHLGSKCSPDALRALGEALATKTTVAHNLYYDWCCAQFAQLRLFGAASYCTLIMSRLTRRNHHGLKALAEELLRFQQDDFETSRYAALYGVPAADAKLRKKEFARANAKDKRELHTVVAARLAEYAATDAIVTLRIFQRLRAELSGTPTITFGQRSDLWQYYVRFEQPIHQVVVDMTVGGIHVNTAKLKTEALKTLQSLREAIEQVKYAAAEDREEIGIRGSSIYAGLVPVCPSVAVEMSQDEFDRRLSELDVTKPADQKRLVLEMLGAPVLAQTARGAPSLSKQVFGLYPLATCKALQRLKQKGQVFSLFYRSLLEMTTESNDVIHAGLSQSAAATGRFTGQVPNLMQLPKKGSVKSMFQAPPGKLFLSVDYSQIELRLMALLSRDTVFLNCYLRTGEDVHSSTAVGLFGADFTKAQRDLAKTINFAMLYGCGVRRLATILGFSLGRTFTFDEAERLHRAWSELHSPVKQFVAQMMRTSEEGGVIRTLGGRVKYPQEWGSNLAAANFPVQGLAAELLKITMSRLARLPGVRLVAPVHDEVIMTLGKGDLGLLREVREAFTDFSIGVPISCSMKLGLTLGSMIEISAENKEALTEMIKCM